MCLLIVQHKKYNNIQSNQNINKNQHCEIRKKKTREKQKKSPEKTHCNIKNHHHCIFGVQVPSRAKWISNIEHSTPLLLLLDHVGERRTTAENYIVSIVIHLTWAQHKWQCKSIYSVCLWLRLSVCLSVSPSVRQSTSCLLNGTFAIWLLTSEILRQDRQRSSELSD